MTTGHNTPSLKIAAAQLDPTVGAITANLAMVQGAREQAHGADLLVTTELVVSGYPPEDLVLAPGFIQRLEAEVAAFAAITADGGPAMLLGAPWRDGGALRNAVLLIDRGRIAAITFKHHLPNYGVFDEKRVFDAAPLPDPLEFRGWRIGVPICEDMWFPDVTARLAAEGAQLLIVPNGSPYETGKPRQRFVHAAARAAETGLPLLYVNQVGGQDELVFDGASFIVTPEGQTWPIAPAFEAATVVTEWTIEGDNAGVIPSPSREKSLQVTRDEHEDTYRALTLGLRDYVDKNGFPRVVLGLSGGIDSALAAALAVDALGPSRVHGVMMPSPYTSRESLEDAAACAALLGIRLDTIGIEPAMAVFGKMLGALPGISGENVQSRLRGMTLMALSNRDGAMVLSTGNKSEMAVGYATLYGDMCGGFAVLKDVYKTGVFALARWRNHNRPRGALGPSGAVMPERVITKPPSAELRPGQTDQDSLPPYDRLDAILAGLIEARGVIEGYDQAEIARVWRLLDRAEYKRRQSPPGVKITPRAFGRERRYPITNHFGPPRHD